MEKNRRFEDGDEVVIGERAKFPGPGMGDWHLTTAIVSVRTLDENEIPPLGDVAYEPKDDDDWA